MDWIDGATLRVLIFGMGRAVEGESYDALIESDSPTEGSDLLGRL
jgi:hypothetical protein